MKTLYKVILNKNLLKFVIITFTDYRLYDNEKNKKMINGSGLKETFSYTDEKTQEEVVNKSFSCANIFDDYEKVKDFIKNNSHEFMEQFTQWRKQNELDIEYYKTKIEEAKATIKYIDDISLVDIINKL